jgi:hypothetical protein
VNWLTWPGYDKLWTNLFRDSPHAAGSEATASYNANDELIVDYARPARAEPAASTCTCSVRTVSSAR